MQSFSPGFLDGLFDSVIPITPLDWGSPAGIECAVARLDQIHPALSGNKLFKLWFYLERYFRESFKGLVTFGGPYSNHLLATAYACHRLGIPCTGIVRGEAPGLPGPTLVDCAEYGMLLRYVSRREYLEPDALMHSLYKTPGPGFEVGHPLIIPEGGAGEDGIRGAALISQKIPGWKDYTHILCATGTGTTLCGIDRSLLPGQHAIGITVMAIREEARIAFQSNLGCSDQSRLLFEYAFGGYARKNAELVAFMRSFYQTSGVPTDWVYTAKAAYALYDLLNRQYFPGGSRILLLHTGGLQGNRSLPVNLFGF